MTRRRFYLYYVFSCIGTLALSSYPIYMGIKVLHNMISDGMVMKEDYPKYIIPYTPISIALFAGILLMPLFIRFMKKKALIGGGVLSAAVFFVSETVLENNIIVATEETVIKLEDWQMYMCYIPPETVQTSYKMHTAVEILMGEYTPAFKLHFYMISVVLILALLNCIYGFALHIKNGEKKSLKVLTLQSVSAALLLALCVLACFTAFWRDGSLQVSELSATLMALFFIILGVTFGIFVGSFLLNKKKSVSIFIPSVVSAAVTTLMYVGESVLLNGHVYKFGNGILFNSLPIIIAPIDILIILLSGAVTGFAMKLSEGKTSKDI